MPETLTDKLKRCLECGKKFIFAIGEQEWFAQRGFEDPRRCKECREKRKAEAARKNAGFGGKDKEEKNATFSKTR